jgi:phosphoglucosamine mutase
MEAAGIEVATTAVGDRYVIEEMRSRDWPLGGEQSGHIIWTDYAPTGDGIGAALLALSALNGRPLSTTRSFEKLPQKLVNVEVRDRAAVDGAEGLWKEVEQANAGLEGRGRVLVRPSGTEPLVRVMVEAPTPEECDEIANRFAAIVERELGV